MSADGSPPLPRPGPSFTDYVFVIPLEKRLLCVASCAAWAGGQRAHLEGKPAIEHGPGACAASVASVDRLARLEGPPLAAPEDARPTYGKRSTRVGMRASAWAWAALAWRREQALGVVG